MQQADAMRNSFSTALALSLGVDALRHEATVALTLRRYTFITTSSYGLQFTLHTRVFPFFHVLSFWRNILAFFHHLLEKLYIGTHARRNSTRSRTDCSSELVAGTSDEHGRAKLIEASLIRTLVKWSPQNAEAVR